MIETPEGQGPLPAGALDRVSPLEAGRETPGSAVPGRVVHCKREAFEVYIGRPSKFGNPWRVTNEASRPRAIGQFESYARERVAMQPEFAESVKALHGKVLGCWCAPKACHGDVLLKLAAELSHCGDERGIK